MHADLPATHAGLAATVAAWLRQWRERHQLLALSDCTLQDLGLRRSDVESVCAAPLREAVDYAKLEARRRARAPRPRWLAPL